MSVCTNIKIFFLLENLFLGSQNKNNLWNILQSNFLQREKSFAYCRLGPLSAVESLTAASKGLRESHATAILASTTRGALRPITKSYTWTESPLRTRRWSRCTFWTEKALLQRKRLFKYECQPSYMQWMFFFLIHKCNLFQPVDTLKAWKFPVCCNNVWPDIKHTPLHCD